MGGEKGEKYTIYESKRKEKTLRNSSHEFILFRDVST